MIRKISFALTALLSGLTANTYAFPKTPIDVSVPCYNGGFNFGLAGLYLRPSSEAFGYALSFQDDTSNTVFGTVQNVTPDYDWGYRINLGFTIPGTGNDVELTYSGFNHATTNTTIFQNDDNSLLENQGGVKFNYRTLDLDFGQHVDFGCRTHFRFLAGLRAAKLDTNFCTVNTENDGTNDIDRFETHQATKFRGVGPRFGSEFEYNLGGGFGVVGQATGALLMGDYKNTIGAQEFGQGENGSLTDEGTVTISTPGYTKVVPNLNGKLGLNYNYQFCNPSHTKLTIEAGYQVDHFFNVADRIGVLDSDSGLNTKRSIDTSLSGPYVGIKVHL